MHQRLAGKIAIVTGGGSWIGKEIAKLFARQGAHVVILGRNTPKLIQTVAEISRAQGTAHYIQTDVAHENAVQNAVEQIMQEYGRVDILIQNAAIFPMHPLEKMRLQDWQQVIHTNLTGTFIILKS